MRRQNGFYEALRADMEHMTDNTLTLVAGAKNAAGELARRELATRARHLQALDDANHVFGGQHHWPSSNNYTKLVRQLALAARQPVRLEWRDWMQLPHVHRARELLERARLLGKLARTKDVRGVHDLAELWTIQERTQDVELRKEAHRTLTRALGRYTAADFGTLRDLIAFAAWLPAGRAERGAAEAAVQRSLKGMPKFPGNPRLGNTLDPLIHVTMQQPAGSTLRRAGEDAILHILGAIDSVPVRRANRAMVRMRNGSDAAIDALTVHVLRSLPRANEMARALDLFPNNRRP